MGEKTIYKLYFALLYLMFFSIPLPYIVPSIVIIITTLVWLFTGIKKNFHLLLQRKYLWGWVLFFLMHALSYFYSTDKAESLFDLESKLSFLILPFIIGTGPNQTIDKTVYIFRSYIYGLVSISLVAFGYGTYAYFHSSIGIDNFIYNNLVRVTETNAVYMAWYTLTGIFILLIFSYRQLGINKYLYIFILFLLQCFFLALSARLLIIIESVFIAPVAIYAYRRIHKSNVGVWFVSGYFVLIITIVFTSNPISHRYRIIAPSATTDWILDKNDDSKTQKFTNVTLRLFLWKTAAESIKEHKYYWIGCGNGDVRKNQKQSIAKYNDNLHEYNRQAELWKYNIHNMYLQAFYMLGIPGILLLLYNVFFTYRLSYPLVRERFFIRIFIGVAALYMCIESALQTQAGIVFFTAFSCLFSKLYYSYSTNRS